MQSSISKKIHDLLRKNTDHGSTEIGGHFTNHELTRAVYNIGTYDGITIKRGVIEFHSHPAKCSSDRCTIPIPSPNDVINICIGQLNNPPMLYHILYVCDGQFIMRFNNNYIQDLQNSDYKTLVKKLSDLFRLLENLHDRKMKQINAIKDRNMIQSYIRSYRSEWISVINSNNGEVQFVGQNVIPSVYIPSGIKVRSLNISSKFTTAASKAIQMYYNKRKLLL